MSRYQNEVFPTDEWFQLIRQHLPLGGVVLDVGCAEGVMSKLAAETAEFVYGIDYNEERILEARRGQPENAYFMHSPLEDVLWPEHDTAIMSMIIHWIGPELVEEIAEFAKRDVAIIYREANEHYLVPEHGSWFPTPGELDAVIKGIRISEHIRIATQDNEKHINFAAYRTDMYVSEGQVIKRCGEQAIEGIRALRAADVSFLEGVGILPNGYSIPLYEGLDMFGDPPFRNGDGQTLMTLTAAEKDSVRQLIWEVMIAAHDTGWIVGDLHPRNIMLADGKAYIIDLDDIEPAASCPDHIPERHRPAWDLTIGAVT